ncbi:MAG: transposase [Planctomycetes bacterium]|nr:transposase [Planctomycetota bacterium]
MPRAARVAPGGMVFHVLNRGNDRRAIFEGGGDYEAFLRVMRESQDRLSMRILAYCLMPNHWHLLLWPHGDGELGTFLQRLTTTHVRRWRLHRHSVGQGHLYQGTYKSFPVQDDDHFYVVARYVERNALRANLVSSAEQWRWSSLAQRAGGQHLDDPPILATWPVPRPRNWLSRVNTPQTDRELAALRMAVARGQPFGGDVWQRRTAKRLGLEYTLNPRGRPRKSPSSRA